MKTAAVTTVGLVIGLTLLPVLLAGGNPAPPGGCVPTGGPISVVLAAVRQVESGGDYTARAARSTASGAYQFLDTTWDHYRGYPRAVDAPPDTQDAKAAEHVNGILERHGGDIAAVPVVWYLGHLPPAGSPSWDTIPGPGAGNRLTPHQYQQHWLDTYQRLLTDTGPDNGGQPPETAGCIGGSVTPLPGGWSLPGPAERINADPGALGRPHHDYPAWDWGVPTGTPIYAIRGGTVTAVHTFNRNWFDAACRTGRTGCDPCGTGLTITDDHNTRWTYCHGTTLAPTVAVGAVVGAGQQIMASGNTGRSSGPHLHLAITTPDGRRRCPQPLLESLHRHAVGVDPATLPAAGCST